MTDLTQSSGHDEPGHHDHEHQEDHGTFKGYMIGFLLSAILTAIPFWLVMSDVLGNKSMTGFVILGFAAVQIVVHMIYFLHMNTRSEAGWNFLALIFTIMLVVITLSGSIWVVYNMNANMMPESPHDMRSTQ
jgi:cytochrome o ubiquinol oxidase operon protein cyoD